MNIFKGSTVLTVLVTLLLSGWPSASQTWESIQESWADLAFRGGQKTPSRESLFWPGFPVLLGVDSGMAIIYTFWP